MTTTSRRLKPAEKVWLQEVAAHLRGLADGDIQPECKSYGLCYLLSSEFGIPHHWVGRQCSGWEEHSGLPGYPVRHPDGSGGRRALYAYDLHENKWADDAYGDARRRLCEFLAETLEEYAK